MITLSYSNKETLAGGIAGYWHEWNSQRTPAMELWAEIDAYIHATETGSLQGGDYFDHKTFIPIVGELYEDLIAIVYSTMFPHEDWLGWQGFDTNSVTKAVRKKVLSYLKQAHAMNGFSIEMRKVIDDLVRYGNCFVKVDYVNNSMDSEDGVVAGYNGPAPKRISPFDIVMNPVSSSFSKSPYIIRSIVPLGEFMNFVEDIDADDRIVTDKQIDEILTRRSVPSDYNTHYKEAQYIPSGFGSIEQYYKSGFVELLWFYGDIYDDANRTLHRKRCVVIADRDTCILDKEEIHTKVFKGGWKNRPDNLWSQGPLDNVVGINYMINHRENGKNDAIDKFIYPDRAYVGDVEEIFDEVTGHTKYILPEGGSVTDISPDTTVLTYNSEIMMHREMARAAARLPQQLAGFRTAGEKTATEVQSLNDGAFRGFINKVAQVEEDLLEPLVKAEIRVAKDNFSSIIRVLEEDENGIQLTTEITEEDLEANGRLIPMGSRRFARQLQQLQGLNTFANSNLVQLVGKHIDTYSLARTAEDLFGFDKFDFIKKFAVIDETLEQEERAMLAEQEMVNMASQPTALEMEDMEVEDED